MANILQNVDELAEVAMLELDLPSNESLKFKSFGMDFVRDLKIDGRTGIANEQKTVYYNFTETGYNSVALPHDFVEVITVGTQIGRYIKALAINAHLTDHKFKNQTGLLTRSENRIWYWGNLWGLAHLCGALWVRCRHMETEVTMVISILIGRTVSLFCPLHLHTPTLF